MHSWLNDSSHDSYSGKNQKNLRSVSPFGNFKEFSVSLCPRWSFGISAFLLLVLNRIHENKNTSKK